MPTTADYEAMREAAIPVKGELFERFVRKCQQNHWVKVGGADFEPQGFCCEHGSKH